MVAPAALVPLSVRLRQSIRDGASLAQIVRLAERLLDEGGIRNPEPSTRRTSLHVAAYEGRADVVNWLLENEHEDAGISRDAAGETCLHTAASRGHLDVVELFLSRFSFTLDWTNADGASALHLASLSGHTRVAQYLIDSGADYDLPDLQGNTPLHYASSFGHISVIQLLVERGCQTTPRNAASFTPSDYAFSFAVQAALKECARMQEKVDKRSKKLSKAPPGEEEPRSSGWRRTAMGQSRAQHPRSASEGANGTSGASLAAVPPRLRSYSSASIHSERGLSSLVISPALANLSMTDVALYSPLASKSPATPEAPSPDRRSPTPQRSPGFRLVSRSSSGLSRDASTHSPSAGVSRAPSISIPASAQSADGSVPLRDSLGSLSANITPRASLSGEDSRPRTLDGDVYLEEPSRTYSTTASTTTIRPRIEIPTSRSVGGNPFITSSAAASGVSVLTPVPERSLAGFGPDGPGTNTTTSQSESQNATPAPSRPPSPANAAAGMTSTLEQQQSATPTVSSAGDLPAPTQPPERMSSGPRKSGSPNRALLRRKPRKPRLEDSAKERVERERTVSAATDGSGSASSGRLAGMREALKLHRKH